MPSRMVERFADLWGPGQPCPDVFGFLEAEGSAPIAEQLAIVLRDQQNRWGIDRPLLVEDYLAQLPGLARDPESKFQLVLGEFFARRGCGLPARVDEFRARFGDLGGLIQEHLAGQEAGEETLQVSTRLDPEAAADGSADDPPATVTLAIAPPTAGGQIGRYKLIRLLGEGTFGRVFLGFDEELGRRVAIKVPAPERFVGPGDAETYLAEARMAAQLDHPNIVPVHDVGRAADGSIFVVSKLIEGRTLKDLIRERRPGHAEAAALLVSVARALHHAHARRLVHRDVKPGNILIEEETGTPYVADFGLAIREEDHPRAGMIAGTPAYMSPEQARGEAHRLDGRSDIFSLGIVFYELLTGRRPFFGFSPIEVLHEIVALAPTPPRELDPSVPPELERICLKALAKRASDRYTSMDELGDDLASWPYDLGPMRKGPPIVPRGLRSFDADDASFFTDLLPGPRDRHGLPDAIRFWKERVEELDAEKTFSVGVLYGPSGCGKSSLVRAGLLPRLPPSIVAVCVDASPDDTGGRILRSLRKHLPHLPADRGLAETFSALRRGEGRKVVIVIDQFEQWLHAQGGMPGPELVDALRQCDGGRLQAVVMVRDDFAMAAARFMDALDIPIVQGHNFATLDLFAVDHARLVLLRFGQAFGHLPAGPPGPSAEQRRFLDAVATGLSRDGKVVPVRLALFAEMVKTRPWIPATLDEAGGTEGIGVNFLEETFSSRSANPKHRVLEGAARNVLKALLPGVGSDIKGNLRSSAELREASGLGGRPADFAALLRILDGELRLLTPTDPPESPTAAGGDSRANYWQLTHDYLVPSLRSWLNRKQKETRRGRAELRLEECAASYSARVDRRQLPTLPEWVAIRTLTDRARWTAPERAMMARAGRMYGLRIVVACSLAAALLVAGFARIDRNERLRRQARADGLVDQLLVADVAELAEVAAALARDPAPGAPRLEAVATDPRATRKERLRASYALADRPGVAASRLIELAAAADLRELAAIRDRLAPVCRPPARELWIEVGRRASAPVEQLRIATLLAACDGGGAGWPDLARPVVATLLTMETLDLDALAELLRPAVAALMPQLRERFFDASATSAERVNAARVLARLADAPLLVELLLEANAPQFAMLFPATHRHAEAVVRAARQVLEGYRAAEGDDRPGLARRRRNAAITLLRLGDPDPVEALLSITPNPTVRTMVMLEMRDFGVPPDALLKLLDRWKDPAARQAVVLALEPYSDREWSPGSRRALADRLARLARYGPHQAERGAAAWLLGSRGGPRPIEAATPSPPRDLASPALDRGGRDWWLTPQGHTMTVVDIPGPSPGGRAGEPEWPGLDQAAPRRIAVGAHEVTVQQYRRFKPNAEFRIRPDPVPGDVADQLYPATMVSFLDAIRYCRWLSEREGIREEEMCYPPIDQIGGGDVHLAEGRRNRAGYRLPTEQEWEFASSAGTTSLWYGGESADHLTLFAWMAINSRDQLNRVGMLRPNPLGLFDMLGNASEWCHPTATMGTQPVLRGGYYHYAAFDIFTRVYPVPPDHCFSFTGFRVVRTIAPRHAMGD